MIPIGRNAGTFSWAGSAAIIAVLLIATPTNAANNSADTANTAQPTTPDDGKLLSKKLDENDGVIVPPEANIDKEIKITPPDPNTGIMRIIPPPGSPGGDQSVEPK